MNWTTLGSAPVPAFGREPSAVSPNPRSPVEPGGQLGGKYRVEHEIGAGSMGIVCKAWHIGLDQPVAIKFLYPEFARHDDGAERFRREARAAAKIRSEHVAQVLDVGTTSDDTPYIVMEYLDGRDLSAELAHRGPLPVLDAVRYVVDACEAVAEAHSQGIVHRDLKPANLFLHERSSGETIVKVLDFGISKVSSAGSKQFSLTDTSTLMGSPAYMSPEQLESSRNVDARADIWSLGVILHELILGVIPFGGGSVPQLVRSILAGHRRPLTERDPKLEGLEQVVARCLRQERNERFQSVQELCVQLRAYAGLPEPHRKSLRLPVDSEATLEGPIPSLTLPHPVGGSAASTDPGAARGAGSPGPDPDQPSDAAQAIGEEGGPAVGSSSQVTSGAWGHTHRPGSSPWQKRALLGAAALVVAFLVAYQYQGSPGRTETLAESLRGRERAHQSPTPAAPGSAAGLGEAERSPRRALGTADGLPSDPAGARAAAGSPSARAAAMRASEGSGPEASDSEASDSEGSGPEGSGSGARASEATPSRASGSGVGAPGADASGASASSGARAPAASGPGVGASSGSGPSVTVFPGNVFPGNAAPGNAAPGGTTPVTASGRVRVATPAAPPASKPSGAAPAPVAAPKPTQPRASSPVDADRPAPPPPRQASPKPPPKAAASRPSEPPAKRAPASRPTRAGAEPKRVAIPDFGGRE